MKYYNARWYNADLGKFISEDPAGQGWNWYGYAGANPINHFDPTGLDDEDYTAAAAATGPGNSTDDPDDDDKPRLLVVEMVAMGLEELIVKI